MIPILYESTETSFTSNGLGRLRDCISCPVTEERNGIYECDFEYPVTGSNFDEITLGRIIGVTHDETGDVQPFDIVSYSKPIDGVVTFHCVHISYRQSFLTVTASSINTLSDAFTALGATTPANPFTYSTDKASTGYCACLDGTPRSVRQVLGGIEGSILDAYGGEYEWDKFDVILHSARGEARDFAIRYGVNMLSFNDEMDSSETYSSVIPYWTDGTTTVIGDEVASGETTVGNHGECVPLDVSDKFENQPSKANVETMAASLLASNDPYLPTQTIKVEFVRLQDLGFAEFSNLLECKLCDSIKVIFPDYNMSGQFKIVKTVWDVLLDRYDSMELGALSGTLSDALGIQSTLGSSGSGGGGSTFQNMWYATCSTGSGTTAKVASTTTTGFTLSTGNMVRVKFTNANTAASPTLNVDGTGAIAIKKYGTTASMAYMWRAGEVVDFVYDGTNFVMSEGGLATTTYYGVTKLSSSTSSTSTSLAATPSAVKSAYDLAGTKSTVSVTQTLASGTEIGSIDVDGTTTKLYAPSGGGGGGVDYITAEGTNGDWTYRRWNSGDCECWYRGNIGTVTLSTQLGTDIVSAVFRISFPFTFDAVPSCIVGYEGNGTGYASLQATNTYKTTTSASYGIRLVRIGTSSVSLTNNYFTCYVKGTYTD